MALIVYRLGVGVNDGRLEGAGGARTLGVLCVGGGPQLRPVAVPGEGGRGERVRDRRTVVSVVTLLDTEPLRVTTTTTTTADGHDSRYGVACREKIECEHYHVYLCGSQRWMLYTLKYASLLLKQEYLLLLLSYTVYMHMQSHGQGPIKRRRCILLFRERGKHSVGYPSARTMKTRGTGGTGGTPWEKCVRYADYLIQQQQW